jgi:hypothetical protein
MLSYQTVSSPSTLDFVNGFRSATQATIAAPFPLPKKEQDLVGGNYFLRNTHHHLIMLI